MKHVLMKFVALLCLGSFTLSAQAQTTALPDLPAPIQDLVDKGAQIRYLGREHGLDSWITIQGGREQYFYVLPSGEAFTMGLLFDATGKLITARQVKRLQEQGDPLLDALASDGDMSGFDANISDRQNKFKLDTPAERLFTDMENSNWIPLGEVGAPIAYTFMDPQCPHCHAMMKDLRDDILKFGKIQLRVVPVGFTPESKAQSAFLLAAPNPQKRWFDHLSGDETALPAKTGINAQGVERNMAIMQSWKFSATPITIYRGKDGTVKIIRGRPKDKALFLNDLGARN